jgi:hypothetical protein
MPVNRNIDEVTQDEKHKSLFDGHLDVAQRRA